MGRAANLAGIVNADGALGYPTGTGGTVTQATSKSTAVTLNKVTGQITTHNAALASNAVAQFVFNNSTITGYDSIALSLAETGISATSYNVWAMASAGKCYICIKNISGGSLSEAVAINFAVIKGAAA